MTWLYLRWTGLCVMAVILAVLTYQHYQANLASVTPEWVLQHTLDEYPSLRVEGMVKSGTLSGNPQVGQVEFDLTGVSASIPVHYQGAPPENLRELKTLIVVGRWDPAAQIFRAHETALVTNFGFVISAYVITVIPLALFLFTMTRKVALLFHEIKQSKLYEPEADIRVDQR